MSSGKIVILILLILSLITACKTNKEKQAIIQTKLMLTKIDSLTNVINSNNYFNYCNVYNITNENVIFFENNNFNYNDSLVSFLKLYKSVNNYFKSFTDTAFTYYCRNMLTQSMSQIANLQHDIKLAYFDDNQIDVYINDEDSILKTIEDSISAKLECANNQYVLYLDMQPKIIVLKKYYETKY